jgi:hypothetical protein
VLSKIKLLICANIFLLCATASAQAGVWDWAFVGSTGTTPDFARGTLTTDSSNVITSLSGVWNGETISLLSPSTFNHNDNVFAAATPHVDANGFAFSTATSNQWVNIFNLGGAGGTSESVAPSGTTFSLNSSPVTFTAAPSAVPWEPSDVAVIAGVALFGFQRLRRKRQAA